MAPYARKLEARLEQPSPFFGASAVERAHLQYAALLRDWIYNLSRDPQFGEAMRCSEATAGGH